MERKVYLAGAIKGLSYGEATDWREYAKQELNKTGIIGISPMRAKEFLRNESRIEGSYDPVIASESGIVARDRFDVQTCDMVLANLLGSNQISLGTMVEYGWADSYRKPIITIMEKKGNPHDHPFVRRLTGFRVETLDEGLSVAKAILTY